MTSHARVVVIGGGAVGCSALYHLARLGWTDVLLLERDELTAGSTWHAAGNCPTFSTSWSLLKLQRYSTRLYARLAQEVGYDINYHRTGSIRLAHTAERVDEFRHVVSQARAQQIEFELLSPAQIRERHPFLELDGIRLGLWDPNDGDIDPAQLTQAFAKGARDRGAVIHRHTRGDVRSRQLPAGGWRLETPGGAIECEIVINAAGYRGGEVAAMVGEYLPIVSLSHQYLVTEDIPALAARGAARLPLVRDPDVSYYLRQERHGLLLGPYEAQPRAHWLEGLPAEFAHQLFADDLRADRGLHRGRLRARADPRLRGRQARHQRADPLRPGRQSAHGACHRRAQLLPLLRVYLRDRAGRWRRPRHCRVGRQRRAGLGPLAARSPPLPALREQDLRPRQGVRDVPARVRRRLSRRKSARRDAREEVPAPRAPAGTGRGVRRARRLGARGVLRTS